MSKTPPIVTPAPGPEKFLPARGTCQRTSWHLLSGLPETLGWGSFPGAPVLCLLGLWIWVSLLARLLSASFSSHFACGQGWPWLDGQHFTTGLFLCTQGLMDGCSRGRGGGIPGGALHCGAASFERHVNGQGPGSWKQMLCPLPPSPAGTEGIPLLPRGHLAALGTILVRRESGKPAARTGAPCPH